MCVVVNEASNNNHIPDCVCFECARIRKDFLLPLGGLLSGRKIVGLARFQRESRYIVAADDNTDKYGLKKASSLIKINSFYEIVAICPRFSEIKTAFDVLDECGKSRY